MSIEIDGVWLRGCGKERVEVIVEVNGQLVTIIPEEHIIPNHIATVSHYVHANGIKSKLKKHLRKENILIAGEDMEIGQFVYVDEDSYVYPVSAPKIDKENKNKVLIQSYRKFEIIKPSDLK